MTGCVRLMNRLVRHADKGRIWEEVAVEVFCLPSVSKIAQLKFARAMSFAAQQDAIPECQTYGQGHMVGVCGGVFRRVVEEMLLNEQ